MARWFPIPPPHRCGNSGRRDELAGGIGLRVLAKVFEERAIAIDERAAKAAELPAIAELPRGECALHVLVEGEAGEVHQRVAKDVFVAPAPDAHIRLLQA